MKIASSQKQASSLTGIPLAQVKLAKAMACPAFTAGGRIRLLELQQFVQTPEFVEAWQRREEPKSEADEWVKRYKRARALREEHRLEIERSKLWDAGHVKLLYGAGDAAMAEVLRLRLEEHPPLVAGKSAGEILKINRKFYDELVDEMRESRVEAILKVGATLPEE